ncbi:hypothetical protein like AT3G59200 [Hibiscus trionum]|uniref:F-box domain-containing protein n=1 Tax=Hibiscus trionum TaxID=183268 RepID=A0A9W7HXM0_HIBTR|nr:hypothetical protein like AT3G59200 [Hibiscus trionum]
MAKLVKFVGDLDRISSLPDHILCHILSFIPTKDAVQTSVVSPRWRYLFASMPTLDFQYCLSNIYSGLGAENFKNFVDRLLFFPNHVTLECFRFYESSSGEDDYLRLYGWICAALWRGVKEIDIRYKPSPVLPTFLFTSQSLMTLKLDIEDDMKVPCKVCLPNLKSLRLRNIKFSDGDSIHRLISGCPALEDLVMDLQELPENMSKLNIHSISLKRLALDFGWMFTDSRIDFNYTFVINAPNLVYIKYAGPIAEVYCSSTMNSLEKADVEVYQLDNEGPDDLNRESGATVTISNLLQRICNVKSLRLTLDQPEMFIRMPPEPVLGFHKLVELELKIQNEYQDWQGTWVFQFLYCVPNLETLHLDLVIPAIGFKPLPEQVPSCLLFHLKEIKIRYFDGNEDMFEMISYFLKHASVLDVLKIGILGFDDGEELSLVKKLLVLPRNSKKCRVVTL